MTAQRIFPLSFAVLALSLTGIGAGSMAQPAPQVAQPGLSDTLYDVDRFRPVASYERLERDGANGAGFTVETNGEIWRLDFTVGGRPDGAATRADCHVRVEAPVAPGGRIDGVIVAGQRSWSGAAAPTGLRQVVRLTTGGAQVVEDNVAALCDVGAKGRYRLVDPSRP